MSEFTPAPETSSHQPKSALVPKRLNHVAWVTHDVEATVQFYTRIMGMELVSTVIDNRIPSTGDPFPYLHLFFRMGDGSTIAFFESPGVPVRARSSHPAYDIFDHLAVQAENPAEVDRWLEWLGQNGVKVIGPNDHDGLCHSIYFHDPNGVRLEITAPLDPDWNNHVKRAYSEVDLWVKTERTAREQGRDVVAALTDLTNRVRHEKSGKAA